MIEVKDGITKCDKCGEPFRYGFAKQDVEGECYDLVKDPNYGVVKGFPVHNCEEIK